MTKEQFRKYRTLPRERDYLERRIRILEIRLENVPIIKDKVKSSAKEYPYIETHITVDAPDPRKAHKVHRELAYYRRLLKLNEHYTDALVGYLEKIEDARTRQIMTRRYLEGRKLKDVAIEFDMTEQGIIKIINAAVKNI